MNVPVPKVRAFEEPAGQFRRQLRRLPQPMQREFAAVIDELLTGTLPPGRRFEKLRGGTDLYSVRLSRQYRFVFQIMENGNAKPVAVGPHDQAYRSA
ncbi:MAG: hypothetical protein F4160_01530 [Rhodospirillaceae bacterium]|nr:hypothetical protein [Rhodospirillaceae bacterium]MYH35464.1 hypothetical protein [Rhodospirillaceae bacterium]MYK12974.1 hypothetical protein [Rhodospirillaceae bacterium]